MRADDGADGLHVDVDIPELFFEIFYEFARDVLAVRLQDEHLIFVQVAALGADIALVSEPDEPGSVKSASAS